MTLICIDPGHGGRDSGALGPSGVMEKDVVLDVANILNDLLNRRGIFTRMTRNSDSYPSLRERVELSNRLKPDLFLSIHANAAKGYGHEAYTSPEETPADPIATALMRAYSAEFPELPTRTDLSDGDPDKEARFYVLTHTRAPAVLYELEFIDTQRGEEFLTDAGNQARMAKALADGISAHFGVDSDGGDDSLMARVARLEDLMEVLLSRVVHSSVERQGER